MCLFGFHQVLLTRVYLNFKVERDLLFGVQEFPNPSAASAASLGDVQIELRDQVVGQLSLPGKAAEQPTCHNNLGVQFLPVWVAPLARDNQNPQALLSADLLHVVSRSRAP